MVDLTKLQGKGKMSKLLARFLKENRAFIPYKFCIDSAANDPNELRIAYSKYGFKNDFLNHWETLKKNYGFDEKDYNPIECLSHAIMSSFCWSDVLLYSAIWKPLYHHAFRVFTCEFSKIPEAMPYKDFKKLFVLSKNG